MGQKMSMEPLVIRTIRLPYDGQTPDELERKRRELIVSKISIF